MLDNLLTSMSEVATILLPILGAIVLIALAILLFKLIKMVDLLPNTIDKVNNTIDVTQKSIEKLDAPLNTIVGVSHTVDTVNKSATGIVSSVANYAIKNSDSLVNWSKDFFKKEEPKQTETQEEDFGIYE